MVLKVVRCFQTNCQFNDNSAEAHGYCKLIEQEEILINEERKCMEYLRKR